MTLQTKGIKLFMLPCVLLYDITVLPRLQQYKTLHFERDGWKDTKLCYLGLCLHTLFDDS